MADKWPLIQSVVQDMSCQSVYWLWQAALDAGRLLLTRRRQIADASLCKWGWVWDPSPLTSILWETRQKKIQRNRAFWFLIPVLLYPKCLTTDTQQLTFVTGTRKEMAYINNNSGFSEQPLLAVEFIQNLLIQLISQITKLIYPC